MPGTIAVTATVRVPASALSFKGVRSSGPGGQNVNKVASKVELRVDPSQIEGLDDEARERLARAIAPRRDADGLWLVTSQRTRDQGRNLEDAREKVRAAVLRALVRPKPRRPTRASRGQREARLRSKHRDAEVKRARGRVRGDD